MKGASVKTCVVTGRSHFKVFSSHWPSSKLRWSSPQALNQTHLQPLPADPSNLPLGFGLLGAIETGRISAKESSCSFKREGFGGVEGGI